jgi:FAD/FMN-containing dehydrogenase
MHHSEDRISASSADELRGAISGGVALPGDEFYDAASRIWNGAVRHRPALIAFCDRPQDVQTAVHAARRYGLSVPTRGGGHNWAGRALRDGGLVIDLTGMRDVSVDLRARMATVAGGAQARDVAAAAGAYGLVAAIGNCGVVGMAGLTNGGGGYGSLNGCDVAVTDETPESGKTVA